MKMAMNREKIFTLGQLIKSGYKTKSVKEEIRENLKEALELIIESNRELYAREHTEAPVIRESI